MLYFVVCVSIYFYIFRFHPNLILGGTYSGQIVLWDNRVQKRTPVQRTPLSSQAHTVNILLFFNKSIIQELLI